ncbi:hypothetical protein FLSI110296_01465 [Flavobacterium sinopsychrotolerans]
MQLTTKIRISPKIKDTIIVLKYKDYKTTT